MGRQPGIGPAEIALRHIDPPVRRVPVARVQELPGHSGEADAFQLQAMLLIHARGATVEPQSQTQPEQTGQDRQPEDPEPAPGKGMRHVFSRG